MPVPRFYPSARTTENRLSMQELASMAQKAWSDIGHPEVRVWVEEKEVRCRAGQYYDKTAGGFVSLPEKARKSIEICSNLFNGLPPRKA